MDRRVGSVSKAIGQATGAQHSVVAFPIERGIEADVVLDGFGSLKPDFLRAVGYLAMSERLKPSANELAFP